MTKKERILSVAQEMFGQYGYSATTMKMIAEGAGAAYGLVAHHFGAKENLLVAAGFDMVDQVLARIRTETAHAETGLEAIIAFTAAFLDFTLENPKTCPVLVRCSPFSDVGSDFPRELVSAKFEEFLSELAGHLRQGMEDGSIGRVPVRETSLIVYGNIVGAVRTRVLTPYETPRLYGETLNYIRRALGQNDPEGARPAPGRE